MCENIKKNEKVHTMDLLERRDMEVPVMEAIGERDLRSKEGRRVQSVENEMKQK